MADAVISTGVEVARIERLFTGGPVLCDGAMGTMLYARGVFINRCYDELNLSQPDMVREVHAEYLQAGAQVIETNTFGANRFRLEHFGFGDRVREINVAGEAGERGVCSRVDRAAGREAGAAGQGGAG